MSRNRIMPCALRRALSHERDVAFADTIGNIPRGCVASYGEVAVAAGHPRLHRAVARFLRGSAPLDLPWFRVVGSGGDLRTTGKTAVEQRMLLRSEGITFVGARVDIARHRYRFEE